MLRKFIIVNVAAAAVVIAGTASATHFRSGQLITTPSADPTAPANTIEVKIQNSWRLSGGVNHCVTDLSVLTLGACTGPGGMPAVGDIVSEEVGASCLSWGDGTVFPASCNIGGSTSHLLYVVTSIDPPNDWFFGEVLDNNRLPAIDTTISHTYPTTGLYTVAVASCCRISAFNGANQHMNNPDGNYRIETIVNVGSGNSSPTSAQAPIRLCPINGICQFQIPAADPNSDPLTYRLADPIEASGSLGGFFQPGYSAAAPNPATISAAGLFSWDTNGARLATGINSNTLYSVQIMIEDGISKTPLDFLIQLTPADPQPPVFPPPPANVPPICNSTQVLTAHLAKSFDVNAYDPDPADSVSLNVAGLPPGANMTPNLPVVGGPGAVIQSTFTWTPTELGTTVVQFDVTSSAGGFAQCPVTLIVDKILCDSNFDSMVDSVDILSVWADIDAYFMINPMGDMPATDINDLRDANGDGVVNVIDLDICMGLCTVPGCGF